MPALPSFLSTWEDCITLPWPAASTRETSQFLPTPSTWNFQPTSIGISHQGHRLSLHFLVCNFHRLICFTPRRWGGGSHNYFVPSCKELYWLKNIIIAVLWAQQRWFLFVILSYYAASLQNYLDRNNYTQCSQIWRITDCGKLESLILNIYIMLSCFCSIFPWVVYLFPCKLWFT